MKPFNHLTFSNTLPADFKDYMSATFGLVCDDICFKVDKDDNLSDDAKIVMVSHRVWEDRKKLTTAMQLRALVSEAKLDKPTCVWDEKDDSGETYDSVQDLVSAIKTPDQFSLVKVGRSVQIDNVYVVVDHSKKSYTELPDVVEARNLLMREVAHANNLKTVVSDFLPKGVVKTQKPTKRKK